MTENQKAQRVIVLTHGLSGSSVLTKLISRAGYWKGDQTFKKHDYDTHENDELISLNRDIIKASGFAGRYQTEFSADAVERIEKLHESLDPAPFLAFIEKCEANQPWIWKDPRLWLTIRFWQHYLEMDRCRFVVLTRDPLQAWISATLRRQIQTYDYNRRYIEDITASILEFLTKRELPHIQIFYEELIVEPQPTIEKLNQLLGTELSLDDLSQVYRQKLYQLPRSKLDLAKAWLIYLKNFRERLK